MCVVGGALSPINLGILRINPKPSAVTAEQRFLVWCGNLEIQCISENFTFYENSAQLRQTA